jgi:hypothetical protein
VYILLVITKFSKNRISLFMIAFDIVTVQCLVRASARLLLRFPLSPKVEVRGGVHLSVVCMESIEGQIARAIFQALCQM